MSPTPSWAETVRPGIRQIPACGGKSPKPRGLHGSASLPVHPDGRTFQIRGSRRLAAAAATTFSRWEHTVARSLSDAGVDEEEALAIASLILAALEGATVMARATGGREPLVRVGQQLASLLRTRMQGAAP